MILNKLGDKHLEKSTSKKRVLELLEIYSQHPKKMFGQNFLIDENIAQKIVDTASVISDDTVLEIGPGLGALSVI